MASRTGAQLQLTRVEVELGDLSSNTRTLWVALEDRAEGIGHEVSALEHHGRCRGAADVIDPVLEFRDRRRRILLVRTAV